jgi:hypothetical protein
MTAWITKGNPIGAYTSASALITANRADIPVRQLSWWRGCRGHGVLRTLEGDRIIRHQYGMVWYGMVPLLPPVSVFCH